MNEINNKNYRKYESKLILNGDGIGKKRIKTIWEKREDLKKALSTTIRDKFLITRFPSAIKCKICHYKKDYTFYDLRFLNWCIDCLLENPKFWEKKILNKTFTYPIDLIPKPAKLLCNRCYNRFFIEDMRYKGQDLCCYNCGIYDNLSTSNLRERLVKQGFPKEYVNEHPEIIDLKRVTILIKRHGKEQNKHHESA